ncbi:MAG: hypothetical protein Q9166_005185 [cf. Caloplaca sp. 2 TL-2023]
MGGRAKIFKFLAGEDVDSDEMDLGMTVLTGLGGGHVDDLAGTAFDDDKTVLPQSGTLHWKGGGGASIGALEGVLMLWLESLRFIFSQIDVIVSSTLAYRYTTEIYRNLAAVLIIQRRSTPATQKLAVTYGLLILTTSISHGYGFTEEVLARVLVRFAERIIYFLAFLVIGAFQLAFAMWLERLSGQSTPSGSLPPVQKRAYSPAPRRSSHLAPNSAPRPSYSPRTSSLGLVPRANSSTTSLNSPQLPSGSSLRQEVVAPVDVVDPSEALEALLGRRRSNGTVAGHKNGDSGSPPRRPSDLAGNIDFEGLSLDAFSGDIGHDVVPKSRLFAAQTIEEYETEKDKFEDLHRSILACDDVLKSVQTSLTSFQQDLGAVSAEIETLQSRSTAMNTRLENRKVVENLLGPAIEEVSISPEVVSIISEGPIDASWVRALEELDKRSTIADGSPRVPKGLRAATDVKPLLDDLLNKALERIRDFFVSQIKALRSPNINAQIIQQQAFVRYKELYGFLARHHPVLGEEIGQAYINTMRWYYLSNFTRYKQVLERVSLFVVDKTDAIGADQTVHRTPVNKTSQPSHDALAIGRRTDVLKQSNHAALPSHIAEENKQTHYLETPFLHFNLALIDNATAEYSFLANFFSPAISFQTISRHFAAIFSPTFSLGHAFTKSLVEEADDCLGILLCVRLNQHFAFELQRRKIPVADGYINGTNMLLWPRFQLAMDVHAESIKRATAAISTRGAASALGLSSSADAASKQSTAPHVLTQRFGQFLQGILVLSRDAGDDEPIGNSLSRLRGEFEAFLTKVGKGFGSAGVRKRERFLANNYSLILTIVGDIGGKLAADVREHFEGLRDGVGGT